MHHAHAKHYLTRLVFVHTCNMIESKSDRPNNEGGGPSYFGSRSIFSTQRLNILARIRLAIWIFVCLNQKCEYIYSACTNESPPTPIIGWRSPTSNLHFEFITWNHMCCGHNNWSRSYLYPDGNHKGIKLRKIQIVRAEFHRNLIRSNKQELLSSHHTLCLSSWFYVKLRTSTVHMHRDCLLLLRTLSVTSSPPLSKDWKNKIQTTFPHIWPLKPSPLPITHEGVDLHP